MRLKILQVWSDLFLDICKHGTDKIRILDNALPKDTKFVRAFYDDYKYSGYINLVLESASFEDIKYGELIPIIPGPIFEKIYEKAET